MKEGLYARVQNPREVLWEGQAQAVSSVNSEGPFDLLPQHANLITLIEDEPILIRLLDGQKKEFRFDRAVIYMRNNVASVYTF